jgi:thiosulfate/3-mercaptopyruvate sulfurtransferase
MSVPSPLVSAEWLAAHLHDPELRVLDATVFLHPNPDGAGYIPESGLARWQASHIEGAQFVDLIDAFSDSTSKVRFTMPPPAEFCARAGALGIGDNSTVVIYSTGSPMWATRLWWMFRSVGFDACAVLDGGFARWSQHSLPVTATTTSYPPAQLTPHARPALWANQADVLAAINDGEVCTINALSPQVYSGEKNMYGRPGHIPGSRNVFYDSLINPEDGTWRAPEALRPLFEGVGAFERPKVICYCGGGISATMDALALMLTGHPQIAVYDGSMMEWVADPALPLTLGAEA